MTAVLDEAATEGDFAELEVVGELVTLAGVRIDRVRVDLDTFASASINFRGPEGRQWHGVEYKAGNAS
jgi:hypothetical protein